MVRRLSMAAAAGRRESANFDLMVRERQLARRAETWRKAHSQSGERRGWLVVSDRGRVPFDAMTEDEATLVLDLLGRGNPPEGVAARSGVRLSPAYLRRVVSS